MCILAADCDEANYKKVIIALCKEKNVPLFEIPKAIELGEWSGLCKLDKEGTARKVVSTSVVSVTEFGEDTAELRLVMSAASKK